MKILMFSTHEINTFAIYREKSKFSFYFILLWATCNVSRTEKGDAENAKTKIFSKPK